MNIGCVYHSIDLDGWMSMAIVKHWFNIQREKYVNSKDVSIEGLPYGTHYKSKKKYVLIPDE